MGKDLTYPKAREDYSNNKACFKAVLIKTDCLLIREFEKRKAPRKIIPI